MFSILSRFNDIVSMMMSAGVLGDRRETTLSSVTQGLPGCGFCFPQLNPVVFLNTVIDTLLRCLPENPIVRLQFHTVSRF